MNLNLVPANDALARLQKGNQIYLKQTRSSSDISADIREHTLKNGQHPYAVIITCSDSRVVPEFLFNANIGDLFVIRVAGNVMDDHQLGSMPVRGVNETTMSDGMVVCFGI